MEVTLTLSSQRPNSENRIAYKKKECMSNNSPTVSYKKLYTTLLPG